MISQERVSNLVTISMENKILEQVSIDIATETFVFMKITLQLKLSYNKLLYSRGFAFLMFVTKNTNFLLFCIR